MLIGLPKEIKDHEYRVALTPENCGQLVASGHRLLVLVVTKANSISTIHRATYLDYIGVKTFDARGRVTGERRFIGLFTSATYSASPREIPLLRHKVQRVIDHFGISPVSHDGKALMHVLESHPRDELFQASVAELVRSFRGIVNLYERRRVRLLLRRDPYRRFFSCLLYVPRDRYNTQARERIERILMEELAGDALESQIQISESALARLHILVRTDPERDITADIERIEQRIAETLRTWEDRLREELQSRLPTDQADEFARLFASAFPVSYQENMSAAAAIPDLLELAGLGPEPDALGLALSRGNAGSDALHLRLYRRGQPIAMSDLLPLLEHFDLRVRNERPYRILNGDGTEFWIQDLEVTHAGGRPLDPDQAGQRFEEAFFAVWNGRVESDGFNRLVLAAGLDWRQALVLRAVCRYLLQTGLPFSQGYMESVLARHPDLAARLAWLFEARFDPRLPEKTRVSQQGSLAKDIGEALEQVRSPDDDRILRAFRAVIATALRTNHFQRDAAGDRKSYLSLKLDPNKVPGLPKPRPMFEIWVYSPRVEGVHLRMGKVARGGLRWSDRREDFRTEILGLMKAQNVKNTLIVPVGAKGGFVPKRLPAGSREEQLREGTECYRLFIRGLLDLTDNVQAGKVVPPADLVRHDQDDPYLVVAADKGTASFSDTANALAAEYGFWLGDAFASGGSAGYDHKKMGITAKGAWECVKRHFREMGVDTQAQDFTVAGIGDMAGDVFGNGMLLSRHIRLVAAFNHQHIFLYPDPDAARSFRERERLFALPRSSWTDYDARLISKGGGVFPRDAKEIALSAQARALLDLDSSRVPPQEIIRAILRLPVDLLYNGGVGTYVKAASESHADVGDRANDLLRINGKELRCKVVAEGGNLGCTQRGRIEAALGGVRINTDAIDNSAGVDTSDHEVNIKILLGLAISDGEMTLKQRNALLPQMTDDVAALVLRDNYFQSQALSLAGRQGVALIDQQARFIRFLERAGRLNRAIEFLPGDDEMQERKSRGVGLTSPEMAVLLAYSKMWLSDELIASDLPEDPWIAQALQRYFPALLREKFGAYIPRHPLKREIIATYVLNSMVNRVGSTFVHRLSEATGARPALVVRAYLAAREVFGYVPLWQQIEALDNQVSDAVQAQMVNELGRLGSHAVRWFLRSRRLAEPMEQVVKRFAPAVDAMRARFAAASDPSPRAAAWLQAGVPAPIAQAVVSSEGLFAALDIAEIADATQRPIDEAIAVHAGLGQRLGLARLHQQIDALPSDSYWQTLAKGALGDDLTGLQRAIALDVLGQGQGGAAQMLAEWEQRNHDAMERAQRLLTELGEAKGVDLAMLSVALRELRNLA